MHRGRDSSCPGMISMSVNATVCCFRRQRSKRPEARAGIEPAHKGFADPASSRLSSFAPTKLSEFTPILSAFVHHPVASQTTVRVRSTSARAGWLLPQNYHKILGRLLAILAHPFALQQRVGVSYFCFGNTQATLLIKARILSAAS